MPFISFLAEEKEPREVMTSDLGLYSLLSKHCALKHFVLPTQSLPLNTAPALSGWSGSECRL